MFDCLCMSLHVSVHVCVCVYAGICTLSPLFLGWPGLGQGGGGTFHAGMSPLADLSGGARRYRNKRQSPIVTRSDRGDFLSFTVSLPHFSVPSLLILLEVLHYPGSLAPSAGSLPTEAIPHFHSHSTKVS